MVSLRSYLFLVNFRSSPSETTTPTTPNSNKVPSTTVVPPGGGRRGDSSVLSANPLSDEIRIYEVEDTPVNLSEKSSFSDLTVDDPQGSGGRVSVDSNDGLIQHYPQERHPSQQSQR